MKKTYLFLTIPVTAACIGSKSQMQTAAVTIAEQNSVTICMNNEAHILNYGQYCMHSPSQHIIHSATARSWHMPVKGYINASLEKKVVHISHSLKY